MSTVSVACVGVIVQDEVFHLDELPTADGKYFANDTYSCGGGMSATAAVAIARLGGNAAYFGRVGADERGASLVRQLQEACVSTEGVRKVPSASTSHSAVLVDSKGARVIINHTDPALDADASWLPVEVIGKSDAVLADVRWHEGALAALTAAKRNNRIGLLDADVSTDNRNSELLAHASHAVFSWPALRALSAKSQMAAALHAVASQYACWLAVTAGSDGVYWLDDREIKHLPAPNVKARNTLGAGDVFHGALALALAEGACASDALTFASQTAAIKCTRNAGWQQTPTRDEVNAAISTTSKQ